ncbi:DUF5916 domain-containing protein [Aquimarina sp. 2201CG1-2-11]|uniref:DUF5916 domain-containing protein n=1 Tax=Aquimarina discodermiae TaxID=3231043 RepID=UPI0034633393
MNFTLHKIWYILLVFCWSITGIIAQTNDFSPPEHSLIIQAKKASEEIKIDGKLIESDWQQARVTKDFFRREPRQGGAYKYETEVKVLFDEKNIYFGVFCKDSLGKKGIRVQNLQRDFDERENDVFAIQIDAQNLKQYSVSFQTTPFGNQKDLQDFNDRSRDANWNALWTVRTQRTPEGYYAEFAIPFKALRYEKPKNGEEITWGITMSRLARRDYEQTVFPPIPQAASQYRMTYAAQLKGLELPNAGINLRIEPYMLSKYTRNESIDQTTSDHDPKTGLDIKWAFNPRSVLDLTVNTDFAQADVDLTVNNLERFNLFFPERRSFFLENSGIWAGSSSRSVLPFFSRKIGLQGNFNAIPVPIDVGARFTDRNEKRTLGALYIRQRETDNSAAANFGVLRYTQNFGKENNIGIMYNHRLDEPNTTIDTQQNNNSTVTVDGFMRFDDTWSLSYLLSGTYDENQDKKGIAGSLLAAYRSSHMYWGWSTDFVSKDYLPGTGFVFQNNAVHHDPGGYFIIRPKKIKWIRRWDPGLFINYYHDYENPENFQQANLYLFPVYVFFSDNSFLEYSVIPTWQNVNFDFSPLGIPIEQQQYFYNRQTIRYRSDQSKKLSISSSLSWGGFYNGNRTIIKSGIRYAPIPHISIGTDYEYNALQDLGISKEDKDTHIYTANSRLAISPQLQLTGSYQYNSFSKQGFWNARFSWEYAPLSFLYLVFNETRSTDDLDPTNNQQLIGKLTFLKQF